jgi:hypothetical protein
VSEIAKAQRPLFHKRSRQIAKGGGLGSASRFDTTRGVLPEQQGPLMQNRSGIDELLTRAILQEIGETLRGALSEEELTPRLRSQLDRLTTQLDNGCSPATAPEPPGENPRTTVAQRLVSRMRRRTQSRQSNG